MGPTRSSFSLAWFVAASPALPGPAPSPPPPPGAALYVLRYRTTAGCPTEDRMRADVGAHLRPGIRPSGVEIEIQLAGTAGRFTGQLLATDCFGAEDRQSLSGADCAEIARALAFLAGLAVELGERRQADLVRAAPPASPASAQPPPPAPPPPHAFRITGRILAGATGGLADGPSLLGEVGVAVEDTRPRLFAPAFVGALSRRRRKSNRWAERERGALAAGREARRLSGASFEIEGRAPPLRRVDVRGGQRTGDQLGQFTHRHRALALGRSNAGGSLVPHVADPRRGGGRSRLPDRAAELRLRVSARQPAALRCAAGHRADRRRGRLPFLMQKA